MIMDVSKTVLSMEKSGNIYLTVKCSVPEYLK